MSLLNKSNFKQSTWINHTNTVAAKIQQRRYQILVHSLLYYELDISIVPDYKWSQWAAELVQLQKDNSEIAEKVIFHEHFKNFDGSTGFNLPYTDSQIISIAGRLLDNEISAEAEQAKISLSYLAIRLPSEWDKYKQNKQISKITTRCHKEEVKPVESKCRKGLFNVPRVPNR